MTTFTQEVERGERYEFGKNWQRFLGTLNQERIEEAQKSLRQMLGVESLDRKSFLDIGSGSGLFSLAAMKLGASRVHSFDYDPQSVACTRELRRRFYPESSDWTVDEGSVLDKTYLAGLGRFDIVYSWGVLHHTGDMWLALQNASERVKDDGTLFIAIYNDQGRMSGFWRKVKVMYNRSSVWRAILTPSFVACIVAHGLALDVIGLRNPFSRYSSYGKRRGMSLMPDVLDWLGGYPFEVAKAEEITKFYNQRGFTRTNFTLSKGGKGRGNNQYVFVGDGGGEKMAGNPVRDLHGVGKQRTAIRVS